MIFIFLPEKVKDVQSNRKKLLYLRSEMHKDEIL